MKNAWYRGLPKKVESCLVGQWNIKFLTAQMGGGQGVSKKIGQSKIIIKVFEHFDTFF